MSYLALETHLVVALVYLVLTTVAMVILRKIEQHLRAGDGAMNTATMNEMIRIRGLQKSYGDHAVLRGIDFDVLPSQVVVVIGPSGSGKARCCAAATGWKWRRAAPSASAARPCRTTASCCPRRS